MTKCKLCGGPTNNIGTKLCDTCWELDTRIKHNPRTARRIMRKILSKEGVVPFLVTVKIPEGLTKAEVRQYIQEAVNSWCGSLSPYDPLFDIKGLVSLL